MFRGLRTGPVARRLQVRRVLLTVLGDRRGPSITTRRLRVSYLSVTYSSPKLYLEPYFPSLPSSTSRGGEGKEVEGV